MVHEIGETAGKVWHFLNENGETTFAQLRKKTGVSAELLHQAIGWLAREHKLKMGKKGASLLLSVK